MTFHINLQGEAGPCRVDLNNPNSRGCPFGDINDHFDYPEDARKFYEEINKPAYELSPIQLEALDFLPAEDRPRTRCSPLWS